MLNKEQLMQDFPLGCTVRVSALIKDGRHWNPAFVHPDDIGKVIDYEAPAEIWGMMVKMESYRYPGRREFFFFDDEVELYDFTPSPTFEILPC